MCHFSSVYFNNNNIRCAIVLGNQAQMHIKTKGLINLIINKYCTVYMGFS